MKVDHHEILLLVERLNASTEQLASCGQDGGVDVMTLNRQSREHFINLQKAMILSDGEESGVISDLRLSDGIPLIVERLRALQTETIRCIETLTRYRDKARDDLANLRETRKAIQAYRKPR